MTWNDGKEFGELCWRDGLGGAFSKAAYPIDNAAQVARLRAFLGDASPDQMVSVSSMDGVLCNGTGGAKAYGLYSESRQRLMGWILSAPEGTAVMKITGLAAGTWDIVWSDPWPGGKDAVTMSTVMVSATHELEIDGAEIIKHMHANAVPGPGQGDRRDGCFVLTPHPNP